MLTMIRHLMVVCSLAALVACGTVIEKTDAAGGVDSPQAIDADVVDGAGGIDAAVDAGTAIDAPVTNELGRLCTVGGTNCSAGNTCVAIQGIGSATMGWCSPMCNNMNAVCAAGYTGPAGGEPVCAVGDGTGMANLCAIVCTTAAQCPSGLSCILVPGGANGSICAVP